MEVSKLEGKWWFVGITTALAALATVFFFQAAEYRLPFGSGSNLSQYILFVLSCIALQRGISFTIWLAVLMFSPKSARNEA